MRQACWLAAYFWSLPVGLQSKVKKVLAGSATGRPWDTMVLHHVGAAEVAGHAGVDGHVHDLVGDHASRPECAASIFSMIVIGMELCLRR